MDQHIKEIIDKKSKALAKYKKYVKALEALQGICEHEWCYEGHGHNSKYYTCSKCGAEEER